MELASRKLVVDEPAAGVARLRISNAQRRGALDHEILDALAALIPFARGFGMETAMAIDAHRAGLRIAEIELDLEHRATGRTPAGFTHRARQLADIARVYASRR